MSAGADGQPAASGIDRQRTGVPAATRLQARHGTWRGWVRHLLALAEWRLGRLARFQTADVASAHRLVFVCLGNINRSAFAAAVAQRCGEPDAVSIGLSTATGTPATREAQAEALRHGVDLKPHRATDIADYAYAPGDLLLVMEVRHARALLARGIPAQAIVPLGLWGTPRRVHLHDPHTLSPAYFATCFALIDSAVRGLVDTRARDRLQAAGR